MKKVRFSIVLIIGFIFLFVVMFVWNNFNLSSSNKSPTVNAASIQSDMEFNNLENSLILPKVNAYAKETLPLVEEKKASNTKEFIEKSVFLGDSITKGLCSFNYVEDARVCAKIGINTDKVKQMVDKAVPLNPKNVFILCGINDMGTLSSEQFKSHYTDLILTVKSKLPNSKIYVESILPVLPNLEKNTPYIKNTYINAYNSEIKKIAESEGITYIDIIPLVKGKTNLYASDGLHYKGSFYPLWIKYLYNIAK